jgi:hypothetical protein
VRTRLKTSTAALAAAVLLLTGCGGSDEPDAVTVPPSTIRGDNGVAAKEPEAAIAAAEAAFRAAPSVRVRIIDDTRTKHVASDFVLTKDGAVGWREERGIRVHVIRTRRGLYMRGREYWARTDPFLGKAFGDKWVLQEKGPSTPLGTQLTLGEFADAILAPMSEPTGGDVGKSVTAAGGRPVVRLVLAGGTYDITATGKPYPVRLELTDSKSPSFLFSEQGRRVTVKDPKGAIDSTKPITIGEQ